MIYKFKAKTTSGGVVYFTLEDGAPPNVRSDTIGIYTGYRGYLGEDLYLHDRVLYYPTKKEGRIIFAGGSFCMDSYIGMSWYLNNCKLI